MENITTAKGGFWMVAEEPQEEFMNEEKGRTAEELDQLAPTTGNAIVAFGLGRHTDIDLSMI